MFYSLKSRLIVFFVLLLVLSFSAISYLFFNESERYAREGVDSDEELAIYDLLLMDSLTPNEIKKIKQLSKILLEKIKTKIAELDHWTDKEEHKRSSMF